MKSQGIQGHDAVPFSIHRDYGFLFSKYLTGYISSGIYNYSARPSTPMAAVQLNKMLHSGSHSWINDALIKLLSTFERDVPVELRTLRLAQLVNFLSEAQDLNNLGAGSKTGGYVAFTNKCDPHLLNMLDRRGIKEDVSDWLKGNATKALTWDNIEKSLAGKDIAALNPRIVGSGSSKYLAFDGKLNNSSFFSKLSTDLKSFMTFGPAGSRNASTFYSNHYVEMNKIKLLEGGAVEINGKAVGYKAATKFLNRRLADGSRIIDHGKIPSNLMKFINANKGNIAVAVAALAVTAVSATEAQAAVGYSANIENKSNKSFISELVGTATSAIAGLVGGALAGLVSFGAMAIPAAISASIAAQEFGKYIGNLFYDKWTATANAMAESLAPVLAVPGRVITDFAAEIVNMASEVFAFIPEMIFGKEGLFGLNGPLFGDGAPFQFVATFLQEKNILTDKGMWAYDGFDAILAGTDSDDVLIHNGWGAAYGEKGDDIIVGWHAQAKNVGDSLFENSDEPKADEEMRLILDGGAGDDWVVAFGGEKAQTIGGSGRDWIVNRSNGGVIYGDTIDRLDPVTGAKIEDSVANGDNIWFAPNTTVMDAQHHDVLKFYGLTLTGGNAEGGVAGLAAFGGVGAVAGVANFMTSIGDDGKYHWENSVYSDHLLPWMTYIFRENDGNLDMYVSSTFDVLFRAMTGSDQNADFDAYNSAASNGSLKGWMRIKNVDVVGSFMGVQQKDLEGRATFNMVFKAPNIILDLLSNFIWPSPVIGGALLAKYGCTPLIDQAMTLAAAASRFAKGMAWAAEADPLIIDLDGDGIETTERGARAVYFDVDGDRFAERTGWLGGDDGFLVRDLNGNGRIDAISEMFGGAGASGLGQLAAFDADQDGKISRGDVIWSELKVWRDIDQDGVTDGGELFSLDELGVVAIDLDAQALDVTTPQGARLTASSDIIFADGGVRHIFDAAFSTSDTDTKYAGETGRPAWRSEFAIDMKGFGRIADLSVAMANDIAFGAFVADVAAAMTTPDLRMLVSQAGAVLGHWGETLELTNELTPVLIRIDPNDGAKLIDRAVYVEDAAGGYWTLASGQAVRDANGTVIARASMTQVLAQTTPDGATWRVEQAWSPSTRETAPTFRDPAPYLVNIVDGRAVIVDYGVKNADGSWSLASDPTTTYASSSDILALTHPQGTEWRSEQLGFNAYETVPVAQIGVRYNDATVVDYTVEVTDQDGKFYVWARNLDRALQLQWKTGDSRDFNLRNYEVDFATLSETTATDDSRHRVELLTPAQFHFATSLGGVDFQPVMLAARLDDATGRLSYAVGPTGDANLSTDPGKYVSGIDMMIEMLQPVMQQYILTSRRMAVRLALQGGLKDFAQGLEYDVAADRYVATTDRQLAPMFEAIFAAAPTSNANDAVLTYLTNWAGILAQVYPDYALNTSGKLSSATAVADSIFVLQMAIEAYENVGVALDIAGVAHALGVDETRLVTMTGTQANVSGSSGVDYVYITPGDHAIDAGAGADFYFVGKDFGADVITDYGRGEANELVFTHANADDVIATREGNDLLLQVKGQSGLLRIKDQFLGELNPYYSDKTQQTSGFDSILFADGVLWDRFRTSFMVAHPADTVDAIVGSGSADVMWGGKGNDYLSGGAGGDIYVYSRGDGEDVIDDQGAFSFGAIKAGLDFLMFKGGVSSDQVRLIREGASGDLKIVLLDATGSVTGDTILIKGEFSGAVINLQAFEQALESKDGLSYVGPNQIERLVFDDGSSLDFNQITQAVLTTARTSGDDAIYGMLNDNTLDGGAGNDYLTGGSGSDTYVFGRGYGRDVVEDNDAGSKMFGDTPDALKFTDGLLWTDFDYLRQGASDTLTMRITGTGDQITVVDFLRNVWGLVVYNRIETVRFGDDTVWTYQQLLQHFIDVARTDGDDAIYGFAEMADTLDGGAGDDTLKGASGNDAYAFARGYGHDVILDVGEPLSVNVTSGGSDTVRFKDVNLADVSFSRTALDLIVTIKDTGETLTLKNQYVRDDAQDGAVETFVFADQSVDFSRYNPDKMDLVGTNAGETIEGSDFAERLDGRGGDDILIGHDGGDVYVFDVGYGHDVIADTRVRASWSDRAGVIIPMHDRIVFGAGITRDTVVFTADGLDLVVSIRGANDTLRVSNQFRSPDDGVERFEFYNNSAAHPDYLTIDDVRQMLQIAAGNRGDNVITGVPDQPNTLDGGAGDDVLIGGTAADTYAFSSGYGLDRIVETADAAGVEDRIVFGATVRREDLRFSRDGNDLSIDLGDGVDVVTVAGAFSGTSVETFLFADGSTMTLDQVRSRLLLGSDGDDNLIGFDNRADRLAGGKGSDALAGGAGDDVYAFGFGDGQDSVLDTAGVDAVQFGLGVTRDKVTFEIYGADLVARLVTGDSLAVLGGAGTTPVERFVFDGGETITIEEVKAEVAATVNHDGQERLDHTARAAGDHLDATRGNDHILINGQTLVFHAGDGSDRVENPVYWRSPSTIEFADLAWSQAFVRRADGGADLILSFSQTGDQLRLVDALNNAPPLTLRFADGKMMQTADLVAAALASFSTGGADVINGNDGADVIGGAAGSDILAGGGGADAYTYRRGDGADVIDEATVWSDGDRLVLSDYAPAQTRASHDGDDLILTFAEPGDSIRIRNALQGSGLTSQYGLEQIAFADGTIWDRNAMKAVVLAGAATDRADAITGFASNDALSGGKGSDILSGGDGADTYAYRRGDGADVIDEATVWSDGDRLILSDYAPAQTRASRDGDDLILTFAEPGDSIRIRNALQGSGLTSQYGLEQIAFADGTIWDRNAMKAAVLAGAATDRADAITGFASNDALSGGKGSDILSGGDGADAYTYRRGDGADVIDELNAWSDGDRLILSDYAPAHTKASRDGEDLILTFAQAGDSIRIRNALQGSGLTWQYGLEQIVFCDGAVWNRDDMKAAVATGGAFLLEPLAGGSGSNTYAFAKGDGAEIIQEGSNGGDDRLVIHGYAPGETSLARRGNDLVVGFAGSSDSVTLLNTLNEDYYTGVERLVFDAGVEWTMADVRAALVTQAASDGADVIAGFNTNDTIVGGKGDDDLAGGRGDDVYVFNAGDGRDVIAEGWGAGDDRLVIHGLASGDAVLMRRGNDLVVGFAGSNDSVTLLNTLNDEYYTGVERLVFDDGAVWTMADVRSALLAHAASDGADVVIGSNAGDTLLGGKGDDVLSGGRGDDIYVFNAGDSQDSIQEGWNCGDDRLVIHGLASGDAVLTRRGNDLVVGFAASGDSVTLLNTLNDEYYTGVERVVFDDGVIWTMADIRRTLLAQAASDGADAIYGFNTNDTISGAEGADYLSGGGGADLYLYHAGDGDDRIDATTDADTLRFLDYNRSDIVSAVRADADSIDLVLNMKTAGDRVTLIGALSQAWNYSSQIEFADGTVWDQAAMRQAVVEGLDTSGDDRIVGFDGAETLAAKAGDDVMDGGAGADTYVFAHGAGRDIVDETDASAATDTIRFVDVASTDVTVERLFKGSESVVLRAVGDSADSVTIMHALASDGRGVESIVFSDGVVWTKATLFERLANRAPVARDDGPYSATSGTALTLSVASLLKNDYDPDNNPLTIVSVDAGAAGLAVLNEAGGVVFTPNADFSGHATLTYRIADGHGGFATATADIRVRPVATARDDSGFSVAEDGVLSIKAQRLLANDLDGDRMIVAQVYGATNGSVSLSSAGDVSFTPGADFNGVAQFTYVANTPEGGRAEAVVSIDVTPVNDAPAGHDDVGLSTLENQALVIDPLSLTANDVDLDGDYLDIVEVFSSLDLNVGFDDYGSIVVTPNDYFHGDSHFDYTVADSSGATSSARVFVHVEHRNTPPKANADRIEAHQGHAILEDNPLVISADQLLANDADHEGDPLSLAGVWAISGGTAQLLANGTILFTPAQDFNGEATFGYTVGDGQGNTASAVATVMFQPVNDNPVAGDDSFESPDPNLQRILRGVQDAPLEISIAELLKNDADVEGYTLTFMSAGGADHGTVTVTDHGTIIYTPDADYYSYATFAYVVADPQGAVGGGRVTLWLQPTHDAPPVANDDRLTALEDAAIVIPLRALLGNDATVDGSAPIFMGWAPPEPEDPGLHGAISFNADGDLVYTPDADFNGPASFRYQIADAQGRVAVAKVTLDVASTPDDPTVVDDAGYLAHAGLPMVIRVSDIIWNDYSVDDVGADGQLTWPNPTLRFVGVDAVNHGTAEVRTIAGQQFIVVHEAPDFTGDVRLQYRIADARGLEDVGFVAGAFLSQVTTQIDGAQQTDLLIGGAADETIRGLGGDDWIETGEGDNIAEGGEGADVIIAGGGRDVLSGGAGDDRLEAGAGADTILGDPGADAIDGGAGYDAVDYGASHTGMVADLASRVGRGGDAQGDVYLNVEALAGSIWSDTLAGDDADNRLDGRAGHDTLIGRGGADALLGGAGEDWLEGGAGADVLDGGEGVDTADYSASGAAVRVDLTTGLGVGGDADGDALAGVESLIGSDFADTLTGDDGVNLLKGGRGDDVLIGGAGDDILVGGRGADQLTGGAGVNTADYSGSAEAVVVDMADGGAGGGDAQGDVFTDIAIVEGSYFDDALRGEAGDNVLRGGRGADVLDGRGGFDTADYGKADEAVSVDLALGQGLAGEALGDRLVSIEKIVGSVWADTLKGSGADEAFDGGKGDDALAGGAGSDSYLFGLGDGADVITDMGATGDLDRIALKAGVAAQDVTVLRAGDDLILELENQGGFLTDAVRVKNHFLGAASGLEEVVFADGTTWDAAALAARAHVGRLNALNDLFHYGVEDETALIDPLQLFANDASGETSGLRLVSVQNAVNGAASIDASGRIAFIGEANYNGEAFFDYTVADAFGRVSTARVQVNIDPVNDAPTAVPHGPLQAYENTVLRIPLSYLLNGCWDIDGDPVAMTGGAPLLDDQGQPFMVYSNEDMAFDGTNVAGLINGEFVELKMRPDYFGFAGFNYVITDPSGASAQGVVEINVNHVNQAPRSGEDKVTLRLGKTTEISIATLMANDYDVDGDAFSFAGVHSPTNGAAVYDATSGMIAFTPDALGQATFHYDLVDALGALGVITVNLKVIPLNDPPVAVDDAATALSDQPLVIDPRTLLVNDTDEDGDALTLTGVDRFARNGKVTIRDDGMILFTPKAYFNGEAGFGYQIADGHGGTATGHVLINVLPVNHGASLRDDLVAGVQDEPLTILAGEAFGNDSDPEGDVLFFHSAGALGALSTDFLSSGVEITALSTRGRALPDWLRFDAATLTITGVMPADVASYTVELKVYDPVKDYAYVRFVTFGGEDGVNLASLAAGFDAAPLALAGHAIRADFAQSFGDLSGGAPDGDVAVLTMGAGAWTVASAGNQPLPDWLAFDEATRTLSHVAGVSATGAARVQLRFAPLAPTLEAGAYASSRGGFTLEFVIDPSAPLDAVNALLVSDTVAPGKLALDLSQAAAVTARTESGNPLPGWLHFDPASLSFTGEPPPSYVGALPVRLDVTGDGAGLPSFSILADVVVDATFHVVEDSAQTVLTSVFPELVDIFAPTHFNGAIAVQYTTTDEKGGLSVQPAIDIVNVAPRNVAPVAADDALRVVQGRNLVFTLDQLLDNDRDANGDMFRATSVSAPAHGTLVFIAAPVDLAPPAALAAGAGAWSARLSDGSALPDWMSLDAATGHVTARPPLDVFGDVTLRFSRADGTGGEATFALDGNVRASFVYTPDPDYFGAETLSYTLTDGKAAPVTASVAITVAPLLVAKDDVFSLMSDVRFVIDPASLLANDVSGDGLALTITGVSGVTHGALSFENGLIAYVSDHYFDGLAGFDYVVSDGAGHERTGHVDLHVTTSDHAPLAGRDVFVSVEDTPLTIAIADLLANDVDSDGETIQFVSIRPDAVTGARVLLLPGGRVSFTPDANVNGPLTFTYQVTDGYLTSQGQVEVDFAAVNDGPNANPDGVFVGQQNQPLRVSLADLLVNDVDVEGDAFRIVDVIDGDNGSVMIDGTDAVFAPRFGYYGNAAFKYVVEDARGARSYGAVALQIEPTFHPPIAVPDGGFSMDQDTTLDIDPAALLANDIDTDGNPLTFVGFVGGPATQLDNGMWRVTPPANFSGFLTLTYAITNGSEIVVTGDVMIDVRHVEHAPIAVGETFAMTEDEALTTSVASLLANDYDLDSQYFGFKRVVDASHVAVTLGADRALTITPDADYNGPAWFDYEILDSTGRVGVARVDLAIAAANDAPTVALPIPAQSATAGSAWSYVAPAQIFNDVDGDMLVCSARLADGSALPSWLTFNAATGGFAGTPPASTAGTLTIALIAVDAGGLFATATLALSVAAGWNPTPIVGSVYGGSTLQGTGGSDTIVASGWNNVIYGGGGNDVIAAGSGSATVVTGAGDDVVTLSGYSNVVDAGQGNNRVTGSLGSTRVAVGDGNNVISTGGYNNVILAGNGNNAIIAGAGSETVTVGNGSNVIKLDGYSNVVTLGSGTNVVTGGLGSNTITMNGGTDDISLYGWSNKLIANSGAHALVHDIGSGTNFNVAASNVQLSIELFDVNAVINLTNRAGGFASASAAKAALISDGHGGAMLSLGAQGGFIEFLNVAPNQISAAQFRIF